MPTDAGLHAQMTFLIQEEKRFEATLRSLSEDAELWKTRVQLADDKDRPELARQARERLNEVLTDVQEAQVKLDTIKYEKQRLRREARRPTGVEVERAEAMVDRLRQSGVIDPEEAMLEQELDEVAAEQALRELRRTGEDQIDLAALREFRRRSLEESD